MLDDPLIRRSRSGFGSFGGCLFGTIFFLDCLNNRFSGQLSDGGVLDCLNNRFSGQLSGGGVLDRLNYRFSGDGFISWRLLRLGSFPGKRRLLGATEAQVDKILSHLAAPFGENRQAFNGPLSYLLVFLFFQKHAQQDV